MSRYFSVYTKGEPRFVCYLWRWTVGWAELLSAFLRILSLGFINCSLVLEAARKLAASRIKP